EEGVGDKRAAEAEGSGGGGRGGVGRRTDDDELVKVFSQGTNPPPARVLPADDEHPRLCAAECGGGAVITPRSQTHREEHGPDSGSERVSLKTLDRSRVGDGRGSLGAGVA